MKPIFPFVPLWLYFSSLLICLSYALFFIILARKENKEGIDTSAPKIGAIFCITVAFIPGINTVCGIVLSIAALVDVLVED